MNHIYVRICIYKIDRTSKRCSRSISAIHQLLPIPAMTAILSDHLGAPVESVSSALVVLDDAMVGVLERTIRILLFLLGKDSTCNV